MDACQKPTVNLRKGCFSGERAPKEAKMIPSFIGKEQSEQYYADLLNQFDVELKRKKPQLAKTKILYHNGPLTENCDRKLSYKLDDDDLVTAELSNDVPEELDVDINEPEDYDNFVCYNEWKKVDDISLPNLMREESNRKKITLSKIQMG
ncbi:hypothetical protein Trydic_g2828, partial [Trypoxylus dichotomus]